jgi:hypothetical protein
MNTLAHVGLWVMIILAFTVGLTVGFQIGRRR